MNFLHNVERSMRAAAYMLLVVLLHSSSVFGQRSATLRVPQSYKSIQLAIHSARVGDTVLVDHGIYYENLRIDKNIVVASRFLVDLDTSHISRTIIDGSRPQDRLKASTVTAVGTDTNCVVLGFTIRGGAGTYVYVPLSYLPNALNPQGPHWFAGGGVLIDHAGARIAHNIIANNTLSGWFRNSSTFGAGIGSLDSTIGRVVQPYLIIEYNTIVGNVSSGGFSEGPGIDIGQPCLIRGNTIIENRIIPRSRGIGGGVCICINAEYEVVVDGNYVSRNISSIGAGILVTSGFVRRGKAILTNNIVTDNEAYQIGGGVHVVEEAYAVFINNTIVGNRALASGGGINVATGAHVILVNNILWKNEVDQVSNWGSLQAANNLVQGGLPGRGNIDEDPAFVPNDPMFRLSPASPGIGTGLGTYWIADKNFSLPVRDFAGNTRAVPPGSAPDLGASEVSRTPGPRSQRIVNERIDASDATLKLTIIIRQISPAERIPETREIIHAGRMSTTVVLNDSAIWTPETGRSLVLPPGRNLLEVEIISKATDTTKALNVYYQLEGSDPDVRVLSRKKKSEYRNYADLNPGAYRLRLLPQDDSNIIGHTNKVFIDILVEPFWYQQWWAYALVVAGGLALTALFFLFHLRRARLTHTLDLERVEAKKLVELDRMKSRFFANLSHEFRTPLTLILGPADQLESTEPQPARKEQLGMIRRNAERLLRMVDVLLQFARVESGMLRLQVSLQHIPQLLRRIVSSFSTAAVKKGIALHMDIEPAMFKGYVDVEKVEHVLENLLSNAIKYTCSGGRVDVRARRVGTELTLEVSDTGLGILPEHLPHVFERFYRVDSSHQYEGTGIGLSLTKEFVDLHHGTIDLKSTAGVGTVVSVRLPLSGYQEHEISAQDPSTRRQRPEAAGHQPVLIERYEGDNGEKSVVLLAEDNEDAREYLRSCLAPEFDVIEAVNGIRAWEIAIGHIPDLVVTDVMMPEMSGYELCARVKQDERTSHIPVILLTALADVTEKIEGLQTGADEYLTKPFDARELLVRMRNILANRKKLQERFRTSISLKPGEVKVESLNDAFLVKVMTVVENHLNEETFGVEQLAREVCLSRAQLHRKLKALTNLSPTDFIRTMRLMRARDLLKQNGGTVSEIAYQVGFTNHSYFAKCFKEQFGYLPSKIGM